MYESLAQSQSAHECNNVRDCQRYNARRAMHMIIETECPSPLLHDEHLIVIDAGACAAGGKHFLHSASQEG